jgi:hypothetical protein
MTKKKRKKPITLAKICKRRGIPNFSVWKKRGKMKTLIILCILLTTTTLSADTIGTRIGYSLFEGGGTEYSEGFGEELMYGVHYRKDFKDWWIRTELDRLETGNEFSEQPNVAYEGVDLKQYAFGLTGGYQWKWLYAGIGIDYLYHGDTFVELYPNYPDKVEVKDALGYHLVLGATKKLTKNLNLFVEGKRIWGKADIEHNGDFVFKEDVGSLSVITGLEWRF